MKKGIWTCVVVCLCWACYGQSAYCLPSYSKVCKALLEVRGWKASVCEGMNMQGSPMGNMVTANRTYIQGNKKVEVVVMSGMGAMGYWAPFQSNMQIDTPKQFVKVVQIRGHNVGISYDKETKSGGVIVALGSPGGPGMVKAILGFNFYNMDWEEALSFAKKFDWDKLEKIFP